MEMNNIYLTKTLAKDLKDNCILKNGTIIDPVSGKKYVSDIKIVDGKIDTIKKNIEPKTNDMIIDVEGKYVTCGFFDMHVHFRDPGYEQAENLVSGSNAAMAGGFTGVALMPNTTPCVDNKFIFNEVEMRAKNSLVEIHQIPAVTIGRKGEAIVEMSELVENGAIAFSDDGTGIAKGETMRRALEYTSMFDVPVLAHSEDVSFVEGVMNEGYMSTILGMAGISSVSEETMIARDILLAEYTGGKVHFQHVSTIGGVELVREAKKKGLNVTCEVTPHHFSLSDKMVETFSTDYKMKPPLRADEDVKAMLDGLKDGTIDAIATDHAPHTPESKNIEFDYAPFGVIGLETSFAVGIKNLVETNVLTLEEFIQKLTVNPRKILNLDYDLLKEGKDANLTIFDTKTEWKVDRMKFNSLSRNTAFANEELKGEIFGVINKSKIFLK